MLCYCIAFNNYSCTLFVRPIFGEHPLLSKCHSPPISDALEIEQGVPQQEQCHNILIQSWAKNSKIPIINVYEPGGKEYLRCQQQFLQCLSDQPLGISLVSLTHQPVIHVAIFSYNSCRTRRRRKRKIPNPFISFLYILNYYNLPGSKG